MPLFSPLAPEADTAAIHGLTPVAFAALHETTRTSLRRTAIYATSQTLTDFPVIEQRAYALEQIADAEAWLAVHEIDAGGDLAAQMTSLHNVIMASAAFWPTDVDACAPHEHPMYAATADLRQLALQKARLDWRAPESERNAALKAARRSLELKEGADVLRECWELIKCLKALN